jgi:hypothetical protein
MRVALGLLLVSLLTACGGDEPAAEPALIPPAIVDETEEPVVDPSIPQPDAAIEAVVVDADSATTVAGDEGRVPTPEAPVIEAVAYDDLAYVEGERVIIRTQMGSTREGVLKRFLNTGLKVVVNERGREIELDMPRSTIADVKVVWTRAQGAAPVPAPAP